MAAGYIERVYPLRYHAEQARLWASQSRFKVVPAGRRSGKTEIEGKRKVILCATLGTAFPDARFFCAAPTRDQAKRIYWDDLKSMINPELIYGRPAETSLMIRLVNGSEIHVLGMDKPERIEGVPWDGGVLDEIGNMKKDTWPMHVRASLSDRNGWCSFIGVPEGRNHYFGMYQMAKEISTDAIKKGEVPEWDTFWWKSADILPAHEIVAAKRDLDEVTYRQEYEADFVHFSGMAYHSYSEKNNLAKLDYNPTGNLIFTFDFNVAPGTAAVMQIMKLPEPSTAVGTGIIGDVLIPSGSNTIKVGNKLIRDWGNHRGKIFCYGDATGGAKGTAKVLGSDWALIKQALWSHFGQNRVVFKVPLANPKERDRLNSMNSRLHSYGGEIRMMIDPKRAPHVVRDFEGTVLTDDGSGQIDKTDQETSHLTDGVGYHIHKEWPVGRIYAPSGEKYWN